MWVQVPPPAQVETFSKSLPAGRQVSHSINFKSFSLSYDISYDKENEKDGNGHNEETVPGAQRN